MKSVFSAFGQTFFLRIIIPGLFAMFFIYSLFFQSTNNIGDSLFVLSLIVVVSGIVLTMLDNIIYRYFEGRFLARHCHWIYNLGIRYWKCKVERCYKKAIEIKKKKGTSHPKYLELRYWLRSFPVNDKGKPTALSPTIMGNILTAAEDYPRRKYGMNSIFFFYRIWIALDKDTKAEIDLNAAYMDSAIYTKFVLQIATSIYFLIWLFKKTPIDDWLIKNQISSDLFAQWQQNNMFIVYFIGALILCCFFHMVSIPLVRAKGEYFKSMFDVYRGKIEHMTKISSKPTEREKWKNTFVQLQSLID